ncbi:MAG TPA: M48 family metallopeptidase [Polyangiaceae bacterium]|nr:M48 family metallopeptidase [Polyangiaceae bacterium]
MQFLLLVAFCAISALTLGLAIVNRRYQERHAHVVPPELQALSVAQGQALFDADALRKAASYARDRSRFGVLRSIASRCMLLAFFFGGGLGVYDRWVSGLGLSFIAQGVVFALGIMALSAVWELPFSVYRTFALEQKHGFNRMTPGLFISDALKGLVLGGLMIAGLSAAALWLVRLLPNGYWLAIWGLLLAFNVFVTLLAPYVIEPLFFKMTELAIPELGERIQRLADRAGVRVSRVLKMDASRRSSHSNAYFTGFGPVKRVVLFDTLIERMMPDEILAVLAHELGHWKKRHITQRFLLGELASFVGLWIVSLLVAWPALPEWVFLNEASLPARAVIVALAWSVFSFPLTPLASAWSRRHEREADRFARDLTQTPRALATALAKLARDNLASLTYHPWFEAVYASHPSVVERVRTLTSASLHAAGETSAA